MNQNSEFDQLEASEVSKEQTLPNSIVPDSDSRRKALTKIAYGSPVIAGLLLSKSVSAQASPTLFTPPPPPGG